MEIVTHKEFTIESMKDYTFRVANISPLDILAISYQVDLENFHKTKATLQFALENVEVKVGETWLPVKVKDREIYQPQQITTNLNAMNEIFVYMLSEVISKIFQKSNV